MRPSSVLIRACAALLLCLAACTPRVPSGAADSGREAPVLPDYRDVTVPCNIAPLNFRIEGGPGRFITVISGDDGSAVVRRGAEVRTGLRRWRRLLAANRGGGLEVRIYARTGDGWEAFRPFRVSIAEDPVDEYVSYRLIAPTYGMAGEMSLVQRRLSDFSEREIFNNMLDYDRQGGQCINCHSFQAYGTSNMQFHVRQKDGGTVIVHDGSIRKVNLRRDGIISAGVYPSWHPSEPLIAYSVNSTYQNFFSTGAHKTEVIDNLSDLILYDVESDTVTPVLTDSLQMETFPYWSADGKTLYYCQASLEGIQKAAGGRVTDDYDKIRYNLMRMGFDPQTRVFSEPELLFDADTLGRSATLPRPSPDGRYLLFTLGEFGNFHIWHKESDLFLMDFSTGEVRRLENVNSDDVESYHSWSSNGRWIVFSSRRDDGLFTRLYLAYFDRDSHARKPFAIPWKDSRSSGLSYKSYNIPEFTVEPVRQRPKDYLGIILE